ncbi:unnamed protein product [Clonostachys rhizophaga]|uniref:Vegetative incompatibility protein HET-E-1 n=1 Tax=Clonostachys rhizophaga TaxID=160324 RepID=A0A9N9YRH8_9HYPO|nr:unnamed protein product [Clonostachys rhizophaga]
MAASSPDPFQAAFTEAAHDFKSKLNNDDLYREILKVHSIDQVYDVTDKLQAEQAKKKGRMRNLARIKPYLEKLREYHNVINVFVQAKPDIMALIWGPILLLLQMASSLVQSFDAIVDMTGQIGNLLPEFKEMTTLFSENKAIKGALVLFFRDILDFYVVALELFGLNRWHLFFESVWPKQKEKISIIIGHIERHTTLIRSEVRLGEIREEHEARKRQLVHFELTEKAKRLQEFNRIMTSLKIKSYDRDLDRIRGRTCEGTGKWLLKNSLFVKWLDTTDYSSNLLWLQGIPGAGKTFLTATAIMECMNHHKTGFAFLSHSHSADTTALSVVHSIISQLSSEDENLQSVVCQSATNRLRLELDSATQLLQDLVACVGPTYLVIDGLNEIEEIERKRLLEKLVTITSACREARVMVSSQAPDDIAKVLNPLAPSVLVHANNFESIQEFVDQWTREWLNEKNFIPECELEIRGLLAPISSKAAGMFLYVKIMLSSIELLSEVDEIRSELRVLPESLDEAYGRIFRRINAQSSDLIRAKSRTILGWICCSSTPMTLRELEQALVVHSNPQGGCRVSSTLNIIKLCGPIVETIDGFVYMVHFSVKEYLSSPRIDDYIDVAEATLSLAICCIRYLCQGHHEAELHSSQLEENIIMGRYRLHHYALRMWLDLVVAYLDRIEPYPPSTNLIKNLERLAHFRYNHKFDKGTALDGIEYPAELHTIEANHSDLFNILKHAAQFMQKAENSQFQLKEPESWLTLTPLTIFQVASKLQQEFDREFALNCGHGDDCGCIRADQAVAVRHYGQQRFKCEFISCPDQRLGFTTRHLRSLHHKTHSRVWKCDVSSCHYSKHGFLSERMRRDHQRTHHLGGGTSDSRSLDPDMDNSELMTLLFDCVYSNDTSTVSEVMTLKKKQYHLVLSKERMAWDKFMDELKRFAAYCGTKEMLKVTLQNSDLSQFYFGTASAIQGQNMDTLKWLLGELGRASGGWELEASVSKCISAYIATGSTEIRDTCLPHFIQYVPHNLTVSKGCFTAEVIKATSKDPEREGLLIGIWGALEKEQHFQVGLNHVADTTCSIRLAKYLLEHGAATDAHRGETIRTPLHRACRKDTAEAAEFIKFLLYQGASPNSSAVPQAPRGSKRDGQKPIRGPRRVASDEIGAKNISQWLGIPWEELVRRVRVDRDNGIKWPGSFPTVSTTQ